MVNGWTGGQYSLLRALFGIYLGAYYLSLLPEIADLLWMHDAYPWQRGRRLYELWPNPFAWADAPGPIAALLVAGAVVSLALALGRRDREAAWLLLWFDVSLALYLPRTLDQFAVPFAARWTVLLLAGLLPRAPLGSLAALERPDLGGDWRWPPWLRAAGWLTLTAGVMLISLPRLIADPSLLGGSAWIEQLAGSAEGAWLKTLPDGLLRGLDLLTLHAPLLFLLTAPWRRARPYGWLALFAGQLVLQALLGTWAYGVGLLLMLALLADPAWIPARREDSPPVLFYDGACGLCHGLVRLTLAEDRAGRLAFAPLGGVTFERRVPADRRNRLPDSLVWWVDGAPPRVRSSAVLRSLAALGGLWRIGGWLLAALPRPLRDAAYDGLARARKRLFATPGSACPAVPPSLRDRLLD